MSEAREIVKWATNVSATTGQSLGAVMAALREAQGNRELQTLVHRLAAALAAERDAWEWAYGTVGVEHRAETNAALTAYGEFVARPPEETHG